jgi:hypothetical protein
MEIGIGPWEKCTHETGQPAKSYLGPKGVKIYPASLSSLALAGQGEANDEGKERLDPSSSQEKLIGKPYSCCGRNCLHRR